LFAGRPAGLHASGMATTIINNFSSFFYFVFGGVLPLKTQRFGGFSLGAFQELKIL
jgi:hypothetical protein